MLVIRKNVFETNSSSTHAICIAKSNENIEIPEEIYIDLEDYQFGWEFDKRTGHHSKLAYILIGILRSSDIVEASVVVKKILLSLQEMGVKLVKISNLEIETYSSDVYFDFDEGYVDHSDGLYELIEALLSDNELLKRYLFDRDSFIATGNDNSDEDVINEVKVGKTHEIFWKGN